MRLPLVDFNGFLNFLSRRLDRLCRIVLSRQLDIRWELANRLVDT